MGVEVLKLLLVPAPSDTLAGYSPSELGLVARTEALIELWSAVPRRLVEAVSGGRLRKMEGEKVSCWWRVTSVEVGERNPVLR